MTEPPAAAASSVGHASEPDATAAVGGGTRSELAAAAAQASDAVVAAPSWWRRSGPGGSGGGGGVAVLKLELRPSSEPSRHAVQGKGRRQAEYALAEVAVRPWYDSDSLLAWMAGGVQLPGLAAELAGGAGGTGGLLAAEEAQREAFLAAYDMLTGGAVRQQAAAAAAAPSPSPSPAPVAEDAASSGGGGRVLRPHELSEQQLQEAVQQLVRAFGLPPSAISASASTAAGGSDAGGGEGMGGGGSAPAPPRAATTQPGQPPASPQGQLGASPRPNGGTGGRDG
ncbi:hypothetical protein GPECTOR_41g737 [Gonium pectorale]|uniref:Uncharacterized protein n=1 Tax=Gonium pectorale TaxID=33097 RepID=A0A150GAA6_GONPE|nr:hypothetical protein GPECTOR_41g737 [Gonium pectorale]|eukprot:KXZ46772.1 hypothetical protein GPECTOR_41g737 [Gonium pectorale]